MSCDWKGMFLTKSEGKRTRRGSAHQDREGTSEWTVNIRMRSVYQGRTHTRTGSSLGFYFNAGDDCVSSLAGR